MVRGATALLCILIACSCKPRIEYVPVPCPDPPVIVRPKLPIEDWKPGKFTDKEVEKMLWQSLAVEVGYSRMLEEVVVSYRKKQTGDKSKPQ